MKMPGRIRKHGQPVAVARIGGTGVLRRAIMANGPQTETTKASNPKEAFGDLKMPLGLFPDTALTEANLAFLEGALKYGQFNWRVAGVKASTYNRAMRRHMTKWWNGQDRDPATRVRELASVMACCAILIDAELCGKLTDDRPPRADMERVLADAAGVAAHLKQLFVEHNPPQYTEREHGVDAGISEAYANGEPFNAGAPMHIEAGPAFYERMAGMKTPKKRRRTATPIPRLMRAVQTAGRRKRR